MRKWSSFTAWVHHTLGAGFYAYQWLPAVGVGGLFTSSILFPKAIIIEISVLLSLLLIVGGVVAWIVKSKKRKGVLNPLLDITKLTDSYRVKQDNIYEFIKEMTIRARASGVDSYKCKFRWTGVGEVHCQISPSEIVGVRRTHAKSDIWELEHVQFANPLSKGEELSFKLCFTMRDEGGTALPFYQKLIDDVYPNGMTVKVLLPAVPFHFSREILASARGEVPIFKEEVPNADSCEIIWRIKRPKIGCRYKVAWQLSAIETKAEHLKRVDARVPPTK